MKYVVSWETRQNASEELQARGLEVFGKWSPSEGTTFHQFLGRIDGRGGYAVVETDDPALVAKDMATFSAFFEMSVAPGDGDRRHRDDRRGGRRVPRLDQLSREEALGHQVAHDREVRRAQVVRRPGRAAAPSAPRIWSDASARRRRHRRAPPRRCRPGGPGGAAAAGAARSSAGSRGAGSAVRLLAQVWARDQPSCAELVVARSRSASTRAKQSRDLGADRLLHVVRPVLEADGRLAASDPAQVDPAEADRLDALLLEPGQPGVVAVVVVRRRRACAGVLEPQLDVRRQVDHLALDHPGVAVRWIQPGASRSSQGWPRVDHPVGEHLAPVRPRRAGRAPRGRCARRPGRRAARSRGRRGARRWPGEITNGGLVTTRSKRSPRDRARRSSPRAPRSRRHLVERGVEPGHAAAPAG